MKSIQLPVNLTGRFRLEEFVGAGGMGVVWRAWDRVREQHLALKSVAVPRADALARLKREFRVAQQVVHPNVVSLYELFSDDDAVVFSMEWVQGKAIHRAGLSHDRLREHLAEVCEGLGALHRVGLAHCDLKPENVIVESEGRVVILDLGLACSLGLPLPLRADGIGVVGTPGILAPELWTGSGVSEATDAYALGALLYECLVGREPTQGDGPTRQWMAQGMWFPTPKELDTSVPADLSQLAMALLSPDPAARATLLEARRVAGAIGAFDIAQVWIERPLEERRLRESWSRAAESGGALVLYGEGGVGKSALARHVCDHLNAAVAAGGASPVEHMAYQALDAALDDLRLMARTLPSPDGALSWDVVFDTLGRDADARTSPTATQMVGATAALRELVVAISAHRGLILILDDLQWVDADSRRVLDDLMSAPIVGCLFLLVCRPQSLIQTRGLIGPTVPVEMIGLEPLTAGHGESVPVRWVRSLHDRIKGLQEGERDALAICSFSARPLPPRAFAHLGSSEAAVRSLVSAGLLRLQTNADGVAVSPAHDLVRNECLALIGESQGIDRRLGTWFGGLGPSTAAAAAHHFERAGMAMKAQEATVAAAHFALSRAAFGWASDLFRRSVRLGGSLAAIAEPRGIALASINHHGQAVEIWLEGAAQSDGPLRAVLLTRATDLLIGGGHLERGKDLLVTLLAEVGEELPTGFVSYVRFLWNTLHAEWRMRYPGATDVSGAHRLRLDSLWTAANTLTPLDPVAGQAIAARYRAVAFSVGSRADRARALGAQLLFRRGQNWRIEREEALLRDLLTDAARDVVGYVHGARGYGRRLGCDFAGAHEGLTQALTHFGDQAPRLWHARFCRDSLIANDTYAAPLDQLVRRADASILGARARGDRASQVAVTLAVGWLHPLLGQDDPQAAQRVVQSAPTLWTRALQPEQRMRQAMAALQIALYAENYEEATDMAYNLPSAVKRHWRFVLVRFTWHLARGRLALLEADIDKAGVVVAREAAALDALAEPVCLGMAEMLRVGLRRLQGDSSATVSDATRSRLRAHHHGLFADALEPDEDGRAALMARGIANPQRAKRWLSGGC